MTQAQVNLFPKQDEFIKAQEREVLYSGASGTGKTYSGCHKAIALALQPGARIGIVRKIQASIHESTLVTLKECLAAVLPRARYEFVGGEQKTEKVIIRGCGEILLFGVADEKRLGSKQMTHCFVDEATELEEEEWDKLLTLTRLPTHDGRPNQIFACCNPDHPKHWLALRFKIRPHWFQDYSRPEDGRLVIMTKTGDNPTLGESYFKSLSALSPIKRARLRDGLWASAEGLVYPMFSDDLHIADRSDIGADEWKRVIVAVDDGTDPDPFCALRICIDGGGRAHVEREVYARNVLISKRARMVEEMAEGAERIVVDPSAKALRLELSNLGLPVTKANNDRDEGIDRVAERFSLDADNLPRLTISRTGCPNLLNELCAYQRDKNGSPKDGNDHAMDALRYGVMALDRGAPPVAPPSFYAAQADKKEECAPNVLKEETLHQYMERKRQDPNWGFDRVQRGQSARSYRTSRGYRG